MTALNAMCLKSLMSCNSDVNALMLNGKPLTYRVIAVFQYRENYGAHDWNGEGECPQYWKNKGASPLLIADGITGEMMQDGMFVNSLINKAVEHEECNEWMELRFVSLEQELTGSWTYDDIVTAYCDFGVDLEEPEYSREPEYNDKYMDVAESLGY